MKTIILYQDNRFNGTLPFTAAGVNELASRIAYDPKVLGSALLYFGTFHLNNFKAILKQSDKEERLS